MSPVIAAVSHDLAAGARLIERQLGVPPTASFAVPMLLVAVGTIALVLYLFGHLLLIVFPVPKVTLW